MTGIAIAIQKLKNKIDLRSPLVAAAPPRHHHLDAVALVYEVHPFLITRGVGWTQTSDKHTPVAELKNGEPWLG